MSSQTDLNRTPLVVGALPCIVAFAVAAIGCSKDFQPAADHRDANVATLSTPHMVSIPGQISGDPIRLPYLTDVNEITAKPIAIRLGDGSVLVQTSEPIQKSEPVQKSGSGKIELIPKPDPDPVPSKKKPGMAPKVESVPAPEPEPIDGTSKKDPLATLATVGGPEDYNTWPVPDLALVVTGRQHGYIEPCGCTGLDRQKGGVARRFTMMRQLKESGWTLVPIDGGDQVRRFGHQAEIKLQQTVKALKEMNYQAVGFGPDDLRLGVGELLSVAAVEDPSEALYVSANVVLIDRALMPQTKLIEQNGHRVGLTSILDPDAVEVDPGTDITIEPMVASAAKAIEELKIKQASYKVMLFYGKEEAGQQLMREVPGYDLLVVTGGYGEPTFRPLPIEGSQTQMIVTGDKGMYAGLVGLYADQPMKYARVPLTHEFADAPEMRKLMGDYQAQLQALGLEGLGLLPPVPHSSGQKFVGTATCGKCHTNALAIWESSDHAEATANIVKPPKERSDIARHFDPECISCHATGWNAQEYFPYESGYLSLETTGHLTGNGCENCHGPGSDHAAAEQEGSTITAEVRDQLREAIKLPLEKAREKCMTCHDLDNSPDFHEEDAFEDVFWPQVEHYGKD